MLANVALVVLVGSRVVNLALADQFDVAGALRRVKAVHEWLLDPHATSPPTFCEIASRQDLEGEATDRHSNSIEHANSHANSTDGVGGSKKEVKSSFVRSGGCHQ